MTKAAATGTRWATVTVTPYGGPLWAAAGSRASLSLGLFKFKLSRPAQTRQVPRRRRCAGQASRPGGLPVLVTDSESTQSRRRPGRAPSTGAELQVKQRLMRTDAMMRCASVAAGPSTGKMKRRDFNLLKKFKNYNFVLVSETLCF